jgi:hypothetical protein
LRHKCIYLKIGRR